MAIALVQVGTFASGTSSVTINVPAGFTPGNLFLLHVSNADSWTVGASQAGWTLIQTADASTSFSHVFYRWAQAGDTSWDITASGGTISGYIAEFSGVDLTTPINVSANAYDIASPFVAPGVTTTLSNCMVVAASSCTGTSGGPNAYSGWTNGNLTGLTEQADFSYTGANAHPAGMGMATGIKAGAGPTGTTGFSVSVGSAYTANIVIALAPSPYTQLTGNNCKTTPSTTAGGLTQNNALIGTNCRELALTSTGVITQIHNSITGNNCKTTPISATGVIAVIRNLTGANCIGSTISTSAGGWQAGYFAGDNCKIVTTSSVAAITQIIILYGNQCHEPNTSTNGAVQQQQNLSANNCSNKSRTSTGSLTQIHKTVGGVDCVSASVSTTGSIDQTNGLLATNVKTTPTSTAGNVVQVHKTITGAKCFVRNRSTTGASPVVWAVYGNNCVQSNASSAASFYFEFLLVASDCVGSNTTTTGPIDYWLNLHGIDCVQKNLIIPTIAEVTSQLPLLCSITRYNDFSIVHVHQPTGASCTNAHKATSGTIHQTHILVGSNCINPSASNNGLILDIAQMTSVPNIKIYLPLLIASVREIGSAVQHNTTTKGRVKLFHYLHAANCYQKNKTTRRRIKVVRTPYGANCKQLNRSTVGQIARLHDLVGNDCLQANIIDGVVLGQSIPLLLGVWLSALTQVHRLFGNNCKTRPISNANAVELPVLHGANCIQRNVSIDAEINVVEVLTGSFVYQRNKTKRGKIRQIQTVSAAFCEIKHRSPGKIIKQKHRLYGANCINKTISYGLENRGFPLLLSATLLPAAIRQTHKVHGAVSIEHNSTVTGTIAHIHKMQGANCRMVINTTPGALTQNHNLIGVNSKSASITSTGKTHTPVLMNGVNCVNSHTSDGVVLGISMPLLLGVDRLPTSISQIAKLRSTISVQINQSDADKITLVYTLDGVNIVQINLSSKSYIQTNRPTYPDLGILGDEVLQSNYYLEESF